MAFEITKHPAVMGILPSESMDDYNSVNYMRVQSIWAIRMRRFFQRLFGPPKDLPDDGPHNYNAPGM
jgi:arachidonate 5-lipoxygenase